MKVSQLIITKIKNTKISEKIRDFKEKIRHKPRVLITFTVIILILLTGVKIIGGRIIKNQKRPASQSLINKISINKSFEFPGLNEQGKVTKEKIKLTVTSSEKNSEVLVKDQTFRAREGKLFLILNLELQNDTTDRLNIIPGDLIRLTTGTEDKKYAPDLHNNVVLVAPLSVKNDRVGFVIDASVSSLKLLIGELEEKKEEVELKF